MLVAIVLLACLAYFLAEAWWAPVVDDPDA